MKRTELKRRTSLKSSTQLKRGSGLQRKTAPATPSRPTAASNASTRAKPTPRRPGTLAALRTLSPEPGERHWKRKRHGECVLCGTYGRVVWHHVVAEQKIREVATFEQIAAGIVWDPRNALQVGAPYFMGGRCRCHDGAHHPAVRDTRVPYAKVPPAALEFARELMDEAAEIYFQRHYRDAP